MSNSPLSKLTLVMPTYNRKNYAVRNMRYWSGREAMLLVMDGGELPIPKTDLIEFADNIKYFHHPVSMIERLKRSESLISTEYSVLMGDDEFFIPSALEYCILELEADPKLVACMGRCIQFSHGPKGVVGHLAYTEMENYAISQGDPVDRMVAHMSRYTASTIYSVVRSSVWQSSMSILGQKEFMAYAIGELQFELSVSYHGKSKVIPVLSWMRSDEMAPIRGTDPSLIPDKSFKAWWSDPAKDAERTEFLEIMASSLGDSKERVFDISAGVKRALDLYLQSIEPRSLRQKIRRNFVSCLPLDWKNKLKVILLSLGFPHRRMNRPIMEVGKRMADAGVAVDFGELSNIEKIVSTFHA